MEFFFFLVSTSRLHSPLVFPHTDARTRAHLVLVVEQLGELGHGARGQLGVILVVDEVDDGRLELLRGLGQPLHVGHLQRLRLHGQNLGALLHLGEHGGAHPLGSGDDLPLWRGGGRQRAARQATKQQLTRRRSANGPRRLTRLLGGDGDGVLPVAVLSPDGGGSGMDARVDVVHGALPLGHLLHATIGLAHWPGESEARGVRRGTRCEHF